MTKPVIPANQTPNVRKLSLECNSSEWKGRVSELTTDALRVAVTLDPEVCGEDADVDVEELGYWFSVNDMEASDYRAHTDDGRLFIKANTIPVLIDGNLICREDGYSGIGDHDVTFHSGRIAADRSDEPVIEIDEDGFSDEHSFITKALDAISMPSWTNRTVYYLGSAFSYMRDAFCKAEDDDDKVIYQGLSPAYLKAAQTALQTAQHGFEDGKVTLDGVLILISAFAPISLSEEAVGAELIKLAEVPAQDEFARVLLSGYGFNKARDEFETLLASENYKKCLALQKDIAKGGRRREIKAKEVELANLVSEMGVPGLKDKIKTVMAELTLWNEDAMTNDQYEFVYVMRKHCVHMLATLNRLGKAEEKKEEKPEKPDRPDKPKKPVCGNKKVEKGEQCDPPGTKDGDKTCNSSCQWEVKKKKPTGPGIGSAW